MGLDIRLTGADELHRLSRQLRDTADKGLGKEMARGLRRAVEPLKRDVRAEAGRVMPHGGGYAGVLVPALRFRTDVRAGARVAKVVFKTHADGTKQRRDVPKLNAGILKHPVYGRSRKLKRGRRAGTSVPNPWATTTIRAGFWSRPVDSSSRDVTAEMVKVLDAVAAKLAGG